MKNTILLTILLAAVPCSAAVITVEPDGSGDEFTIQDAIDIAIVGDEIVLSIGTYTGDGNRDIDFGGKAITVCSTDPNDPNIVAVTIIDCEGTESEPHRGFSFISGEDVNSIVSGLTVTNGYGPDEEYDGHEYSVGGAIYCHRSSPTLTNCTFIDNSAGYYGGGMNNSQNSSPTVTNCTFSGNTAGWGGGMLNLYNSSPTLTNCTFIDNSAGYYGGGMNNSQNSSPTVTNCTFTGNSAKVGGGMSNAGLSSTVTNCTFTANCAANFGGGMYNYKSSPTLTNCTFAGNWTTEDVDSGGGGVSNIYSSPTITNCTFSGNSSDFGGGMFNLLSSSPTVTNCILWANSLGQVYAMLDSNPTITYSDIQGGLEGEGNIDIDPNFVDSENGDYRLSPVSPCIDTGDPCFVVELDATDLDGNPRIADGDYDGIAVVDMGAFEVQPDPIVLLDILADYIIDLGLEGIGNGRGLLAKLETAIKKLSDETVKNDAAAVNSLRGFINSVEAQSGKKIDEDEADALIAAARQILDMLGGEPILHHNHKDKAKRAAR